MSEEWEAHFTGPSLTSWWPIHPILDLVSCQKWFLVNLSVPNHFDKSLRVLWYKHKFGFIDIFINCEQPFSIKITMNTTLAVFWNTYRIVRYYHIFNLNCDKITNMLTNCLPNNPKWSFYLSLFISLFLFSIKALKSKWEALYFVSKRLTDLT